MAMLGMAPPPAQDVQQQMGPFAMASQRPGPAPGMPGQEPPGPAGDENPITAQVMTALIHLQQAMQQEPALAPAFSSAIKTIQVALGNVLGKPGGGPPLAAAAQSATPPDSPGVGLPI